MTVARHDIPNFKTIVPVVMTGAGACGLTAALAARDQRADVLVLEQDKRPWGSTSMSLGAICAVGSRSQRDNHVEDNVELFLSDVRLKTDGEADEMLSRRIGERSGGTVELLTEKHGSICHPVEMARSYRHYLPMPAHERALKS
ncbi:MAG: FAD-binding protein [Gammaproteobacteria bacterium]|nr:FAD-binding protein [Gammaproteobacteria bacterium]